MYAETERINLIRELTKLCEALLTIQMDEQDRQNIFEHIHICVCNSLTFLEETIKIKTSRNMFYTLLITVNVPIILYLCYAVAKVVVELANEEQNANETKCNCKTSKVVPNQKSAKRSIQQLFHVFK